MRLWNCLINIITKAMKFDRIFVIILKNDKKKKQQQKKPFVIILELYLQ